jgi:hypothetical protein
MFLNNNNPILAIPTGAEGKGGRSETSGSFLFILMGFDDPALPASH